MRIDFLPQFAGIFNTLQIRHQGTILHLDKQGQKYLLALISNQKYVVLDQGETVWPRYLKIKQCAVLISSGM